ncbi:hypothetical protein GCM10020256_38790 [Streptomyces thermocoprophilus]
MARVRVSMPDRGRPVRRPETGPIAYAPWPVRRAAEAIVARASCSVRPVPTAASTSGASRAGGEAVLVGAARRPEQAGVALARACGEDELDEALAVGRRPVRTRGVSGARRGKEQAEQSRWAGRGGEVCRAGGAVV